jgi:hypothetical protein
MTAKNPLIYFFWVLVVLNLIDFISALFITTGEANPIFLLSKSMLPVLALKIATLGVFGYYVYRNSYNSNFTYYLTLLVMMLGIGITGIAAFGNIYAATHPSVLAAATTMTTEEKVSGYAWYIGLIYLMPLLLSVLTFKIYEWTKKYANINKKKKDIVGDVV